MEFGKLKNIEQVNFTIPPCHSGIAKVLGGIKSQVLNVYIGAPVWSDTGFPSKIYPIEARKRDFIYYYGQQFNCIELNATHYRIPGEKIIKRWVEAVPDNFKFCPKIHQSISHSNDISRCGGEIDIFYNNISGLGDKLGTCFLQLPPKFEAKHIHSLLKFLDFCPIRDMAIELRHEGWFSNIEALSYLSNYLYKNNFALNITDVAGRRDVLHQRLTNKTAFIRFVANNLHPSDFKRMDEWVERLHNWIENGLEQIYFFLHTPDKSLTPELAIYFTNRLNKRCNLNIAPPVIQQTDFENKLF